MSVTIGNTYGAALVGCVFAAIFYGITCVQTCRYILMGYGDSKILKTVVYILWVLDTLHLSFIISSIYFFLIINRATVLPAVLPFWACGAVIIFSNVSDGLVRCILLHRIWHLSKRRAVLLAGLASVVIVTSAFGMFYGVLLVSYSPTHLSNTLSWPIYAGLSSSVAADVVMSAVLCVLFRRLRRDAEHTRPLLNRLIMYTINAGVLPSVIAFMSLLAYIIYPETFVYMGIFFVLPKATLNSMLAMLNARKSLRQILPTVKLAAFEKELEETRPPNETPRIDIEC